MRAPAACTASKVCAPLSEQDADEIDHPARALDGLVDRGAVAQIAAHGMDLADIAERLQMMRRVRIAADDADAVAALCQRAHDVAADETGAADDGDEGRNLGDGGHRVLLFEAFAAVLITLD